MYTGHNECGGLNRNDPHRLMCLNIWLIWNDPIRMYDLAGVDVALLEEVCS